MPNIICIATHPTKDEAAKLLGLHTYDTALPQPWLDDIVAKVKPREKPSVDFYRLVLSSFVWCYDDSWLGYPYPLTVRAFAWLKAYDEIQGSHYTEELSRQYSVLDIA
jgi:hypothetical protein